MSALNNLFRMMGLAPRKTAPLPGERAGEMTSEAGTRVNYEDRVNRIYSQFAVDYRLRAVIQDIRHMARADPRVKSITGRTVRAATKGGLRLDVAGRADRIKALWRDFERRTHLDSPQKLESDMRGLFLEGTLPLQLVVGAGSPGVLRLIRMPSESIVPRVGKDGTFSDVTRAFEQIDIGSSKVIARFALWQIVLARLTPDNYDDWGSMGRPYLDAAREVWRKLRMTEDDLVVRRRTRAPLRMAHTLEGASDTELQKYRADVERDQEAGNWRDYFMSRKGAVNAVQGDTNLDQIADVSHLLDTFFTGAPAPKALFGYNEGLSRDVINDLKRDFFDELDAMQDLTASAYQAAFRIDLLLRGINPDSRDFIVKFAERRTETPNQAADRALKYQALGTSRETIWRAAGLDPSRERQAVEDQANSEDPYPLIDPETGRPNVNVTPGNARKGESATTISTRS